MLYWSRYSNFSHEVTDGKERNWSTSASRVCLADGEDRSVDQVRERSWSFSLYLREPRGEGEARACDQGGQGGKTCDSEADHSRGVSQRNRSEERLKTTSVPPEKSYTGQFGAGPFFINIKPGWFQVLSLPIFGGSSAYIRTAGYSTIFSPYNTKNSCLISSSEKSENCSFLVLLFGFSSISKKSGSIPIKYIL